MLLVLTFLLFCSLSAQSTKLNHATPEQKRAAEVLPDGFIPTFKSTPGKCMTKDNSPVEVDENLMDGCKDKAGNFYPPGDSLLSCCGCFKYKCSETGTQKTPTYNWSKEVTTQCCQTCNGTVVPGGTVLGVKKMEDKCGTVKTSVCKIRNRVMDTEKLSETCPDWWREFNQNCYQFVDTFKTWKDAENFCQGQTWGGVQGHLASIHSEEENIFVASLARASMWLGYHDLHKEGQWTWTDGTTSSYSNWAKGEPDNAKNNEDCMEMNTPLEQWNDDVCTKQQTFVCKLTKVMESQDRLNMEEDEKDNINSIANP